MVTKLQLFNGALLELGDYSVADTGEQITPARALVAAYDRVVADCLAVGSWNFAIEEIEATYDTGTTPEFGYLKVFRKPSDWVRTHAVSLDERFSLPLLHYHDDGTYWSADSSPIYVRYVSDDTGKGLDLADWTDLFTRYVELELAHRICRRVTQSESLKAEIGKARDKARRAALNQDAMDDVNPKFPPPSSFTLARRGRSARGDRGNRGSLTG